jgi:hypothetical protein
MINTPHSGTLGYESFVNPFSNSSTGGRLLSLYDAYGYYTQEDGVLYQVQNDGTEKKIADIRTFDIDPASTAEPDFTGKAKGILTQTDIEKAFHINDHVMYIQYRETGTYQEPNDINILYGFFFDTITNTETPIYPVINDDDTAAYFSSSVGSLNAAKVHGKDAVFFTMGGSSGVVVDTDGHYYKINLESNRKFNSYYCVKGDVIYYQAGASEWCSYNYVTGEQAIVSTPDASITMISISANGERVWFFGDDSKLYTMNTDFTDLQLVTDQFDSRQTTMYASTDDTVFFSGAYKQNGAPIPGYYPLTTVKMANGSFIINTFGITE